jgi:hypothetical protein
LRWRNYGLGTAISKITEDTKLWESERGIVEVRETALAIPIKLEEERRGYIFHGRGRLLLDTIAETEEGAIGQPVEKELSEPFLMLGNKEETDLHMTEASEEDLKAMGYTERQEFLGNAKDLFDRFFRKGRVHGRRRFKHQRGLIFAFPNQNDKLDILVAKGSKLVYASQDKVFIAHKDNVVLKGKGEVVCSGKGKSVIINRGRSVIIKR